MSDSTTPQDSAAMSPASTGSVAAPAAWGVLRVGGGWVSILANEVQAETSRQSWDTRENWVHDVIPLYRSPTLTDAERIFLQNLRGAYEELANQTGYVNAASQKEARTHADLLSGLLERTRGAQ